INSTELMERFYWLGLCEYWEDQYSSAISNAENYLRQDSKGDYAEAAYYLMAECYIDQKKFYSAGVVLTKLQSLGIKDIDEQYLMYRLGYVNEQSDKHAEAIGFYRKGYEMDKYSQIAFLIEDRIFELKSRNRSLDIGFLYPYTLLQLPTLQADSTSQSTIATTPAPQPSNTPALQNPGTPAPQNPTTPPLKLSAKPASGFWLQAGRFSQEGNANKLVVNIRLLNIPAAYYADKTTGKANWVVVCGSFPDKPSAEEAKLSLGKHDISSFIAQY
ncbi:MAG: SPOR domain-containing protein, partial [Candidatus Cloacimonetes bacterium]|nr:SPOR domain-containing protein [Candidatus Cloacimonadota bacterium]